MMHSLHVSQTALKGAKMSPPAMYGPTTSITTTQALPIVIDSPSMLLFPSRAITPVTTLLTPGVFDRKGPEVVKEVKEQFALKDKKGRKMLLYENDALVKLPVPFFPRIAASFKVDMWVRTHVTKSIMKVLEVLDVADGRADNQFSITLNIDERGDSPKAGAVRVLLRDSAHRVAYAGFPAGHLFDDKWHFLQCSVVSAADRDIRLTIDGIPVEPVCDTTDSSNHYGPTGFVSWKAVAFVGATTICTGEEPIHHLPCLNSFKGYIADVAFWDMSSSGKTLLARFPFADPKGIRDMVTGNRGELIRGTWETGTFPKTSLCFEGDAYVNVGTLDSFGEHLSFFSVELWMQSSVTDRQMCLMKTTDSTTKQVMGITIHANGKGYKKNSLLVELCDEAGKAVLGTVEAELCDGKWHHLYWAFHYGDVMVVADGTPMGLTMNSDTPTTFRNFSTFFAIGAHNRKGVIEQLFDGYVSNFEICVAKQPFCKWQLDDGPGSMLVEDVVGKKSGTFVHNYDKVKNYSYWIPWHPIKSHGFISSEIEDLVKSLEWKQVEMHDNNVVRAACVTIDSSSEEEVLTDLLHKQDVELSPELPESVWEVMKGYADVKEFFQTTTAEYLEVPNKRKNTADAALVGHVFWLLSVGDATFCLCNVAGGIVAPGAYYNPETMNWQGPVSSFRRGHKITLSRNKSISDFESSFVKAGSRSEFWPRTPQHAPLTMQLIAPFMKLSGSNTFFLQTCSQGPCDTLPVVDVCHSFTLLNGLNRSNRRNAAIFLQKHLRKFLAVLFVKRKKAIELHHKRKLQYRSPDKEGGDVGLPPLMFSAKPSTKRMRALLIASYLPLDHSIEPAFEITHHLYELSDSLAKSGYEVVLIHSKSADFKLRPSRDNVKKRIKQFLEVNTAFSLVWIAGRGCATRGMYNPPRAIHFRSWMEGDEKEARANIEEACMLELRDLVAKYPYPMTAPNMEPKLTSRSKTSISERYKYTYTRWVGTGNKKVVGEEAAPKEKQKSAMNHLLMAAISSFEKFETAFRYRMSDLESSARNRLFNVFDEDLEWAKRYPSVYARHIMLDDSPLACDEESALTVTEISDMVLSGKNAPYRMLVMDCLGWRGEAGHFFFGSAAGHFKGDYVINSYDSPSTMLVSSLLARAALGIPVPLTSQHVMVGRISQYLIERLTKYPRVQLTSDSEASPSCPAIPMTRCIVKTRQDIRAEKEHAALMGLDSSRQIWSLLSCSVDVDMFSSQFESTIDTCIKAVSGVRKTEVMKTVPLPWLDIEVCLSMAKLIRLRKEITEELKEACEPFDVTITMLPALTFQAARRTTRRSSQQQRRTSVQGPRRGSTIEKLLHSGQEIGAQVSRAETSIVRIALAGEDDVRDPRWLTVSKKPANPAIHKFCNHIRTWVQQGNLAMGLCRRSMGFSVPCVGLRQRAVLRALSDDVGAYRITKTHRAGHLFASGVVFDSLGVFLAAEEDRLYSMAFR
eukprot:TRINITY_DN5341_c0_g1_i2.p1 TRINITY_DN5341_c0_g1~~TRINITY_DN5341_c0_g1_i2.p1  ORF type:complete len:1471 (+),score=257.65 TRINITY_DN5341_c0_g1_i2:728-5140(+)